MTIHPVADVRHLNAICRTDFVSFTRRCFHLLAPSTAFLMNWHILAMAYAFEQVRLGKIKRLLINVPPRIVEINGKLGRAPGLHPGTRSDKSGSSESAMVRISRSNTPTTSERS